MPSNIPSTSIPSAPRADPITSNVVAAGGHSQGVDDICCHIDLNCRGGANSRFLQSWKCLGFIAVVVFLVLVVFVLLPFKARSYITRCSHPMCLPFAIAVHFSDLPNIT
ncbi:hypothetical protein BDN71DRAFT_1593668 [Pleurotus eryngii]|uniref:Uncharacterized protein n=1 Tax=Pleurotus eryngii TaxID=5323 RepID=A0A9P5ZM25_PLEER|nr:hypothetical protein BDN71DRAFT_1593668 [Pleurotus eryngii]